MKCGVSKVLAAYITSVLKPSIKHSIITSFSCNNFGWNKTSHIGIKNSFFFPIRSYPKSSWGLFFCCISPKIKSKGFQTDQMQIIDMSVYVMWYLIAYYRELKYFFQRGKILSLPHSYCAICYKKYSRIHRIWRQQFLCTP